MPLASTAGRDRADVDALLTVVADGVRLSSQMRMSTERQVAIAVPRTRDGRRKRRPLGSAMTVCWWDLGEVRSRTYELTDVTGGVDPQWILVPLAAAEPGNRRMVPRTEIAVPLGVRGSAGLVVGTTMDMSPAGARVQFPPQRRGTHLRALPLPGAHVGCVVVIGGVRLEFSVEVVRAGSVGDCRELRLAFTDLDDTARSVLQDALGQIGATRVDQQQALGDQ